MTKNVTILKVFTKEMNESHQLHQNFHDRLNREPNHYHPDSMRRKSTPKAHGIFFAYGSNFGLQGIDIIPQSTGIKEMYHSNAL